MLFQNPKLLFRRLLIRIHQFFEDNVTINSNFVKHNYKIWERIESSSKSPVIITDTFRSPEQMIVTGYFLQVLGKRHNAKIMSFSNFKNANIRSIRKSLNYSGHVTTKLNKRAIKLKHKKLLLLARKNIKSKEDLFNFRVEDIWVGIDIYETYLRNGIPTVDLKDNLIWEIISESIELILFWNDFFENNRVVGVFLSHDMYNSYNSVAKVAYKNNAKVYLISTYNFQISTSQFSIYKNRFINYPKMFKRLSVEEQKDAIEISKKQLNRRLSGEVGVNMRYSTKSAFSGKKSRQKIITNKNNLNVLICTHCFFDNPHAYGEMLFHDFFDWLDHLGRISNKSDYDWYIKPHPDYLPGTIETIQLIADKYKKIKFIDPRTSFNQLADEGLDFALTCYGSVGHELPLLGIQVINCGLNPHMAYNFNWHAYSKKEYDSLLLSLKTLKKEIDINEIYEFYYMNYYYTHLDDLVFNSYEKYRDFVGSFWGLEYTTGLKGLFEMKENKSYDFFLNEFTREKHNDIIRKIDTFIDSGKTNYFIKGPE